MRPDDIAAHLDLTPIPVEGGRFAQTWIDEHSGSIYYLVTPDDFSGLHSLRFVEVWFFHGGAPTSLLLLHPDGRIEEPVLGIDLAAGQRPQVVVPPGVVMAAEPLGEWSLLGTYMSPPYTDDAVEFPRADELVGAYPGAAERIIRMARR